MTCGQRYKLKVWFSLVTWELSVLAQHCKRK
jgi:hypothetical protein